MSNDLPRVNDRMSIEELVGYVGEELEVSASAGFADEEPFRTLDDAPASVQAEYLSWCADVARNEADAARKALADFFGGEYGDDELIAIVADESATPEALASASAELVRRLDLLANAAA